MPVSALRKNILIVIAIAIFLTLSFITVRVFIFGNSFFEYRDTSWPKNDTFLASAITTFAVEVSRRIIYLGPYHAIVGALGLSTLASEKIFFFIIGFVMGFAPFIASYKFMSHKLKQKDQKMIFISSLVFALFYMFNPYAVQKLASTAYGFAVSYSLLPLIFYFFDRSLHEKNFSNIFYSGLLISLAIAGTMQFLVFLPMFLLVPWLVLNVAKSWRSRSELFLILKNASIVFCIWLLISSYWLLMTLAIVRTSTIPQPDYLLTSLMLSIFSEATPLDKVFSLTGVWWPLINIKPIIVDEPYWTFLTFVTPAFALLSVILTRKRQFQFYVLSFTAIMLFTMFFYKGVQQPFPGVYPHLYDIPVVGWMFRVPDSIGMFAPIYMGMIIAIGLYQILSSGIRSRVISYGKFAVPVFLIFSISLVGWPMFTGDYGGAYKEKPPVEITPVNIDNSNPFNVPQENILVLGGYDKLRMVNNTSTLTNKTIIPADLSLDLVNSLDPHVIDKVVLDDRNELPLRFYNSANAIVINPFDYTRDHLPSKVWSVAGTSDPLHGPFHPYLNDQKVKNEDIDFSKGVLLTWGDDTLNIPFRVSQSNDYVAYLRYLENQKGGSIDIDIDGIHKTLITRERTDRFLWASFGTFELNAGKHTISLKNGEGLNAVNLLILIPKSELSKLSERAQDFVSNKDLIYSLDSKSNFYVSPRGVRSSTDFQSSGTGHAVVTNEVRVPDDATTMALEFRAAQNSTSASSYKIENISVRPIYDKFLLDSGFENAQREDLWKTDDANFLSLSLDDKNPLSGSKSLRIDIKNSTNPSANWKIANSPLIPAYGNVKMKIQLTESTINATSPHSKIRFYDNDRRLIGDSVLFNIPSNSLSQGQSAQLTTPPATRYVSLTVWVKPSTVPSTIFLDNIRIENVLPNAFFEDNYDAFKNFDPSIQQIEVHTDYARTLIDQGSPEKQGIVSTRSIAVPPGMTIEYRVVLDAENVNAFSVRAVFSNDTTKPPVYDKQMGYISTISPGYSLFTSVDILKESDYVIAVNIKHCPQCSFAEMYVGEDVTVLPIQSNTTGFDWLYHSIHLPKGKVDIRIGSASGTDLAGVYLYSDDGSEANVSGLFELNKEPVHLNNFRKISDTQYEVSAKAKEPFLLTFDKKYDGLWSIHYEGKEAKPIPLFPSGNGFVVNTAGDAHLSLEYVPQKAFFVGLGITIATLVLSVSYLVARPKFLILFSRITFPLRIVIRAFGNIMAIRRDDFGKQ